MKNVVGVVRGQRVEEAMGCSRYPIGATGKGAVRLRQEPEKPLPMRQLIFLHSNNEILVWLLGNQDQVPLDHLVVESRRKITLDTAQTPQPANGREPFLNRNVWEHVMGLMQVEEDEDEEAAEWLEAERKVECQAPPDGGWRLFSTT